MHALENTNPALLKKILSFIDERCPGEEPRSLSEITGDKKYKSHEIALVDEFSKAYMGRFYGAEGEGGTEILSVGVELIFLDCSGFFENKLYDSQKHEEYIHLILGLLAGR
jgi:hypothetical protein